MKKLMIALGAVAVAASLQAATVVWGGAVSDPIDTNVALAAGQQAALLWSETAFSGVATKVDSWAVNSAADNGGKIVQLHTITAYEAGTDYAFSENYEKSGAGVDGYYAVLVQNDAGTQASYYDIGQISGTTATSSPIDKLVNVTWTGSEYLTSGGYTVATSSVPEPTSGLLLILGMAGLALRRKCA